jgi:hypothetical protein
MSSASILFCISFNLLTNLLSSFIYALTEMEFLDINMTIDTSLLIHAIYSPFYWRVLKKTILWFKNTYKKYAKKENSGPCMNTILWNGKLSAEN